THARRLFYHRVRAFPSFTKLLSAHPSVVQSERKLDDPSIERRRDSPEVAGAERGCRVPEIRVLEHIEELGPELKLDPLVEREILVKPQYKVDQAWAGNDSHTRISEHPERRSLEGAGVEPVGDALVIRKLLTGDNIRACSQALVRDAQARIQ